MKTYSNDTTSVPALQREYLHRGETVKVQFLQAMGTGIFFGIATLVIGIWARWREPWMPALIIWILATGATWMILQRNWVRMSTMEMLTGLDLNRDGVVGEPVRPEPVRSIPFQMNRVTEKGHVVAGERFELPATEEQLVALADGLNNGMGFTVREWCGAGRPFSVSEFSCLRSEMLKRGLLRQKSDKDPRAGGYELTDEGRALLEHVLSV